MSLNGLNKSINVALTEIHAINKNTNIHPEEYMWRGSSDLRILLSNIRLVGELISNSCTKLAVVSSFYHYKYVLIKYIFIYILSLYQLIDGNFIQR